MSFAAAALGLRGLLRSRGRASARRGPALARRYDASRWGRRLAELLWRAQVRTTPSRWRCGQLLAGAQLAVLLRVLGVAPLTAIGAGVTLARSGGRALLWLRRGRSLLATDAATPTLARALATELAAWGSGAQAIAAAPARCACSPAATRVLDLAVARVALGGEAGLSLRRALMQADPHLPESSPALAVATIFALHRHDAVATARALERLSSAIEDDRAVHREASATLGEARGSAVAVPLMAAATAAILFATAPPALVAALSPPLLPLLGGAVVVATAGAVAARRLATI